MENTTFDIIVSGHLCLDLYPDMAHVPPEALVMAGRLTETGPLEISTGGVVSNTGQALHRLGVSVGLMSTVGDDLLGRIITAFLSDRDPALSRLISVQAGQKSSYSVVLSPLNHDRTFLHCTGTNATFGAQHIDYKIASKSQIFHLGYPPILPRLILDNGAELEAIYQRVKASDVVTSLDMTLPDPEAASGRADWPLILRRVLPSIDIFWPSIEEALFMLRRDDFEVWQGDVLSHVNRAYLHDLAGEILDMGAVVTGFKLGEMGGYLRTGNDVERLTRLPLDFEQWRNREDWHPAFDVRVAGTTGAGDSAYAGFLAALLRGFSPHECLRWACAVGACNVEKMDATSGIRTWEQTQARLDAGWPTVNLVLPG